MIGSPILAVTGLLAEARVAAGAAVITVSGGGDVARLALLLQAALSRGVQGVISFGIAGGLKPGLRPGTVVVGRAVNDGTVRREADSRWIARLTRALPHAHVADLAGVNAAVCGIDDKAELHRATGASAADMETHVAARLAALHGVPFAAVRVVADPAERVLPSAAVVGMGPDGTADIGAVLRSLGRRPSQLPGLIRTALDARAAFAALARERARLGATLGFGEEVVAVPRGVDATVTGLFDPDLETAFSP